MKLHVAAIPQSDGWNTYIQEVLADSATSSSDLANVLSPGRKGNLAANSYIICWVLADSLEQIREDLVLLPNGRQDCVH
jgi:hypothetical protein